MDLLGGDPLGHLEREGGELGVGRGRDDLGVVRVGVEQKAAGRGVPFGADLHGVGLLGLLGVVLRLGPERLGVVELEDVDLDLVRVVADRVVGGIGHPIHVVLGEALGPAVDLLEEVLGVERLQVLRAVLADFPAGRDVDQGEHRRQGTLGLGHGGQFGLGLGLGQTGGGGSGWSSRGRAPGRSPPGCGMASMYGGRLRREGGRRGGEVHQLLGAVEGDLLADRGQALEDGGDRLGRRGRLARRGPHDQHRLVELLDVVRPGSCGSRPAGPSRP